MENVSTVRTGTHSEFSVSSQLQPSWWPFCDDTSSDDDEHNTGNTLLLLFADAYIAPALLAGLTEVDELYISLGCRFALDMFTIAQQDRPSPEPDPLPSEPDLEPWF